VWIASCSEMSVACQREREERCGSGGGGRRKERKRGKRDGGDAQALLISFAREAHLTRG